MKFFFRDSSDSKELSFKCNYQDIKFICLKCMYVSGLIVEAHSINSMWQVALIHNTAFVWVLPIPLMAQFLALVIIQIQYKRT